MIGKKNLADYLIYFVCILIALLMILPFYSVVIQSVATPSSIAEQQLYLIPTSFDISSYKAIIDGGKFTTAFGVSLFIAVVGTTLSITITICGGYVLAKKIIAWQKILNGIHPIYHVLQWRLNPPLLYEHQKLGID